MMIDTRGLRKSFDDHVVLDGIDLDVAAGTICALLGPNGARKTTTVQILSTLIDADGGEARVAGHDVAREPDAVRAVIGVTGQFSVVDSLFTGEENLLPRADLLHMRRREARQRGRPGRPLRADRCVQEAGHPRRRTPRPGRRHVERYRGTESERNLRRLGTATAPPQCSAGEK